MALVHRLSSCAAVGWTSIVASGLEKSVLELVGRVSPCFAASRREAAVVGRILPLSASYSAAFAMGSVLRECPRFCV